MTSLHSQTRFQNRQCHILPMPAKTCVLTAAMVISGSGWEGGAAFMLQQGWGCILAAAGGGVHAEGVHPWEG